MGYVYILINPAYQNMVKIGYTTNPPEDRAKELHGTGVPFPFHVAYEEELNVYYEEAEKEIHNKLNEFRCNDKREFFSTSLKKAISVVAEIAKFYRDKELLEEKNKKIENNQKIQTATHDARLRRLEIKQKIRMSPYANDLRKLEIDKKRIINSNAIPDKNKDEFYYSTYTHTLNCPQCLQNYTVTLLRSEYSSVCPYCHKYTNHKVEIESTREIILKNPLSPR